MATTDVTGRVGNWSRWGDEDERNPCDQSGGSEAAITCTLEACAT